MSEWQEITLGEIFKVKHGFAFKGEYFTDEPQNTVLVTPGNFAIGGGFQDGKRKYYNGPVPEDYVLKPGQVVVTMTDLSKESDTLGYAASIPGDSTIWLHNQRVGLLEFKPAIPASPRFIQYLLRTHEYRSWVVGSATGTTVKHTSPGRIESFATRIPSIEVQHAIAHILGTLDDKIELNRRMNETLEAMARAIFQSWFVDFDPVRAKASGESADSICRRLGLTPELLALFPDSFEDSELGKIPTGWDVSVFSETIQIIGGGTPKTSMQSYWDGDIPWFSVVDAPRESDVFVIDTEKKITKSGLENSSAKMLPDGATIISARGTVGKVALVGAPMAMNQSCYGLRGLGGCDFFTYYATRELVSALKRHSHGAVFDTITRDTFASVKIVSCEAVSNAFEAVVAPKMREIKANNLHTNTLVALRDALLPKLLSGELEVQKAEA